MIESSPIGAWFGFRAPPLEVACSVGLIVVVYLACAELMKRVAIRSATLTSNTRQPMLV